MRSNLLQWYFFKSQNCNDFSLLSTCVDLSNIDISINTFCIKQDSNEEGLKYSGSELIFTVIL